MKNHSIGIVMSRFLLFPFILFPWLGLLFFLSNFNFSGSSISVEEIYLVITQVLVSTGCVCFGGVLGGASLLFTEVRLRRIMSLGFIALQLLPLNLYLSSVYGLLDFIGLRLSPLVELCLFHILLNVGFSSLVFYFLLSPVVPRLYDVERIYNLGFPKFCFLLFKSDLLSSFARVVGFFALVHGLSFSLPLIVSEKALSFEVLLYQNLFLGRGAVLVLLVTGFHFLVGKEHKPKKGILMNKGLSFSRSLIPTCILVFLQIPFFTVLFGIIELPLSWLTSSGKPSLPDLFPALGGQILVLSSVFLIYSFLLWASVKRNFFYSWEFRFFIPSGALLLFSSFFLIDFFPRVLLLAVCLVTSSLLFLALFLGPAFERLQSFEDLFRIFSKARRLEVFLKTERWPILGGLLFLMVWSGGDYVYSGALAGTEFYTLGSLSQDVLQRHMIQESQMISILSFIVSLVFFGIIALVIYGKDIKLPHSAR